MNGARRRDAPAHGLDESLGDGEAKTRALAVFPGAIGGLLHAAELLEDALDINLWNARPLILYGNHHVSAVLIDSGLDGQAIGTVFNGVFENVDDRLLQQTGVEPHTAELGGEISHQSALAEPPLHPVDRAREHVPDIGPLLASLEGAPLQAGHVQQIADIAIEAVGLLANADKEVGPHLRF